MKFSQKKFEIFFFAWNVLKHKVKPKNSRNSTFFQKLKFSPLFLKNTCKIFKSKMFTLVCCNFFKSQGGGFNLCPWKSAFFRLMAES